MNTLAPSASTSAETEIPRTDYLTGLANGRAFNQEAEKQIGGARDGRVFTLLYLDIDNFKLVNDAFGRSAGDEALALIGQTIHHDIRPTDLAARLGGDEFGVILPGVGARSAPFIISRLQKELLEVIKENVLPISLSIGAVTCDSAPGSLDDLLAQADMLMHSVKLNGKDGFEHQVFDPQKAKAEVEYSLPTGVDITSRPRRPIPASTNHATVAQERIRERRHPRAQIKHSNGERRKNVLA